MASFYRIAFFLSLYLHQVTAVSLSDMIPTLTNVTGECGSIYRQEIDGCSLQDFPKHCSQSCIQALVELGSNLNDACEGVQVPPKSLIAAFQQGLGLEALCNVRVLDDGSNTMTTFATGTTSSATSTTSRSPITSSVSTKVSASTTTFTSTSTTKKNHPTFPSAAMPTSTATKSSGRETSGNEGTGGDPFAINDSNSSSPGTRALPPMTEMMVLSSLITILINLTH